MWWFLVFDGIVFEITTGAKEICPINYNVTTLNIPRSYCASTCTCTIISLNIICLALKMLLEVFRYKTKNDPYLIPGGKLKLRTSCRSVAYPSWNVGTGERSPKRTDVQTDRQTDRHGLNSNIPRLSSENRRKLIYLTFNRFLKAIYYWMRPFEYVCYWLSFIGEFIRRSFDYIYRFSYTCFAKKKSDITSISNARDENTWQ